MIPLSCYKKALDIVDKRGDEKVGVSSLLRRKWEELGWREGKRRKG